MGKRTARPSESAESTLGGTPLGRSASRRRALFSPTNDVDSRSVSPPRLKLSDFIQLVRRSSAGIACVTFSEPIPCDLASPAAFSARMYETPSMCLEASASLGILRGKSDGSALVGQPLHSVLPEESLFEELFAEWFRRRFTAEGFQFEVLDHTGRHLQMHTALYGTFVNGALTRFWVILRDITALDRAIQAVTKTERHYRTLFDHPGFLFIRTYTDGTLSFATSETRRALNLLDSHSEPIEHILRSACHPSDREALEQLSYHRHSLSREPLAVTVRLVSFSQGLSTYTLFQHPHIIEDEVDTYDLIGIRIASDANSERRETPSTALAAGLAHDANNHLVVASASIELARQSLPSGHPALQLLDSATRAISHCASINTDSINLSQGIKPHAESIDIANIFAELSQQLSVVLPPGIALLSSVESTPLWVYADRTHLTQALFNLALNARDALGSAGTITLSATRKAPLTTVNTDSERPFICVSVSDNGPGIDESIRSTLFHPFVSSKATSRTRGLGLAMVKTLIERNGGEVAVTSAHGVGTTFTLSLLASTTRPTSKPVNQTTHGSDTRRRTLRILLADDEPEVRTTLLATLSSKGHQVTAVPDSPSLLREISRQHRPYDLVILDDGMPGSSASELSRKLNTVDPNLAVVVTSGNSSLKATLPSLMRRRFIAKPFALQELFATVDEISSSIE